jgi:hypothetical protein
MFGQVIGAVEEGGGLEEAGAYDWVKRGRGLGWTGAEGGRLRRLDAAA